jgi:hypothetical protein
MNVVMKKKLAITDSIELATPLPELPRQMYSRTQLKRDLNRILDRMTQTREPFRIVSEEGFTIAVVFDWREYSDLEKRRQRLISVADAVQDRPQAIKRDAVLKDDSFQKLRRAFERVEAGKRPPYCGGLTDSGARTATVFRMTRC